MTAFTQDFFTSRNNRADGTTRLGQAGRLWYDSQTRTVRVSDGVTPGGTVITAQVGFHAGSQPLDPSAVRVGDFWYDTVHAVMYQRIDDGSQLVWVDVTGPNFSNTVAVGYTGSQGAVGGSLPIEIVTELPPQPNTSTIYMVVATG